MKMNRCLTVVLLMSLLIISCQQAPPAPPTPLPATATTPATEPPSPTPTPTPNPLVQGSDGQPWWNDTVFYEVFVRSFYDSDGDGIGDINGLIEKLDYLNDGDPNTTDDLGVTGIWLMPIMQSPSYHGYDVVDYYAIDDEYGTQADFQELMAEAHKRGIRIVVDLVLNHTSWEHPWFQEALDPAAEKRDWYVWSEEEPGYRGPTGQQVWYQTETGYYYAVFWEGMPDLNLENTAVTTEIEAITRFWLKDIGVDGFRLDAIKHLVENGQLQENTRDTHAWLQTYYDFYKEINPEAITVGEAWTSTQQVLKYTGNEVDIAFQFDLALAVINSADSGFGRQVGRAQRQVIKDFPPGQYATFLTNHDQNRIMSQLDGDTGKAKVAATWLLTSPGVPFIYYGEEIGMTGTKPDEDIRLPMQWEHDSFTVGFTQGHPWRAVAADYETRSVALQDEDANSLLSHYRTLIHLRNKHEALRIGNWVEVESDASEVYAYLRQSDDETLLVVINFDDEPIMTYGLLLDEDLLGDLTMATLLLGGGDVVAPVIKAGGFENYTPVEILPPHSSFVIELQ